MRYIHNFCEKGNNLSLQRSSSHKEGAKESKYCRLKKNVRRLALSIE
jgi:hypothetical protein